MSCFKCEIAVFDCTLYSYLEAFDICLSKILDTMNQLNKTDAGDCIIIVCFTSVFHVYARQGYPIISI